MFPALTEALGSVLRGARNALKEANPQEFSILHADEAKGIADISFDTVTAAWYRNNGYNRIAQLLMGGMPAASGEIVSLQTAMNHSVVWACNRLISETQGSTPLVMQRQKGAATQAATDHPMYAALLHAPNDEMSAMSFQETRTSHCALQGNAFAQIIRRSGTGTALELHALDPEQVSLHREKMGQKRLVYTVKTGPETEKDYTLQAGKPHDILHIRGLGWDGLTGYSVISMARQSIGTALAVEKHVGRFYANGGRVPYVITTAKKFGKDQQAEQFRQDWERMYSEPHRVPILDQDLKYQQIGLDAVDSQMLESRLFDIHEICRWWLMSPHLVGDLSRATFSNIEQLALEFVKVTMGPWFNRWEKDLWRCVLTPEEKGQGFIFKHNTTDLTKGDFLTRMQSYSIGAQNGWWSDNDILKFEGQNPYKGGDAHRCQLNMQTIQPDGTLVAPTPPASAPPLPLSQ